MNNNTLREKLANRINKSAREKLALSRREKALLALLAGAGAAVPTIAAASSNAGSVAGLVEGQRNLKDNVLHMKDIADEANGRFVGDSLMTMPRRLNKNSPSAERARSASKNLARVVNAYMPILDDLKDRVVDSPLSSAYGASEGLGQGPISGLENLFRKIKGD